MDEVSKRFRLRQDRADSVGQLLVRMVPGRRAPKPEEFWALRDVSLSVLEGQSVGIIGNNGSGKSTLLKILTRTMAPTSGRVQIRGRLSALIELGAGFHPDFTGRENIHLNASILGISRREITKSLDEIIEFAEIRPFIDVPVKYYSSGMQARLGFSVAIHVEPEILIVDEVLAVGDEAFQQKCMDRIFSMKRNGISILLVSHDLSSVERLMDSAIWLNRGVISSEGVPRDVVHQYRTFLGSVTKQEDPKVESAVSPFGVRVDRVQAKASGSERAPADGEPLEFEIVVANETGEAIDGHLGVVIRRPDGLNIAEVSSLRENASVRLRAGQTIVHLLTQELRLASGTYEVDVAVFGVQGNRLAEIRAATSFRVQSAERTSGLILVPHQWKVE